MRALRVLRMLGRLYPVAEPIVETALGSAEDVIDEFGGEVVR